MTIKEYLLSRLDWRIAKDEWVKSIMQGAQSGTNSMAARIEDIGNSEDFELMNEGRIAEYEALLKIPMTAGDIGHRRKAAQAYWNGGGHPSIANMRALASDWVSDFSADYDFANNAIRISIGDGVPITPYTRFMFEAVLRRHIPAHIALHIDDALATMYITVGEMNGKTISGADSTKLYNFVG